MNAADSQAVRQPGSNGRPSFRARFKAWWEGREVEPLLAPAHKPISTKAAHKVRYEDERPHWETARLRLVQDVWGEGFVTPGGIDYTLHLVKAFGLDPAMTVLDLGAGLGGATRAMCESFGVWVSGLEADPQLAEAAMELSTKAGLAKRAAIAQFDPETFEMKPNSVDCVFSREFFYTVENKAEFLKAIEMAMKSRGQLLFTDCVLAQRGLHSQALEAWRAAEPRQPHPWSVSDYEEAFAALYMDIRVKEDVTQQFHQLVTGGWADYIQAHKSVGLADDMARALVEEVEIWTRRLHAMEQGHLRVFRFHVLKRDTTSLMSDW